MEFLSAELGPHWKTLVGATVFTFLFSCLLIWSCLQFKTSKQDTATNFLLCILGAVLGWALGMFFSPFDKADAERFSFVGQFVAAFVSGYVLSKIDPVLTKKVTAMIEKPQDVPWPRIALFVISFLLSAVVVFVWRVYTK